VYKCKSSSPDNLEIEEGLPIFELFNQINGGDIIEANNKKT